MSIIWDGVCAREVGVVVEHCPAQPGGSRKIKTIAIPGRMGELTEETGAFENYTQPYRIYFNAGEAGTPAAARRVRMWLLRPTGYRRLEDRYDPEVYRRARCTAAPDIENIMNRFGRATITFDCDPRRFLKDGEAAMTLTEPDTVVNLYMPALPELRIYGSGAGTVTVGDCTITINHIANQYIHLDCETGNAADPTGNANRQIYAPEFPVLKPGENPISWTGGVTHLELTPHWWM